MKNFRYLLPLFILLIFPLNNVWADIEKECPTTEEMQSKKWEYMKTEARLTDEEATLVKPIFSDYESKVWDLHKNRRLGKQSKNNPNYEELNDNFIYLETKQAEFLQEYHLKLKKVLSPERLFNYYHAERSYKRHLIFEMQENRYHKRGPKH